MIINSREFDSFDTGYSGQEAASCSGWDLQSIFEAYYRLVVVGAGLGMNG